MRSLQRAVAVLKTFSLDEPEMSTIEITRRLGIPKTTAYRIVTYLSNVGLLDRNPATGKYMIGGELFSIASLYLNTTDFVKAAEPIVSVLNELSQEAVTVGTFDKGSVVYVIFRESPHVLNTNMRVGSVIPAHCSAIGRAFLAELSDEEIDDIYPEEELEMLTDKTVSTKTELKRILCRVKEAGVSFDSEGTYQGSGGFASVIREGNGVVAAALAIALPTVRMNTRKCEALSGLVQRGADLINYRLGYQESDVHVLNIQEIRSWWEQNKADS